MWRFRPRAGKRKTDSPRPTPSRGPPPATATPPAPMSALLSAFQGATPAGAFHRMLRGRERALAASPSRALFDQAKAKAAASVPPVVGEQRTFNVCTSRQCDAFAQSTATAKVVGQRVAIFVDNDAPAGGYSRCGPGRRRHAVRRFPVSDRHHGVRPGVGHRRQRRGDRAADPAGERAQSRLQRTGSVILGYFFGADLLPLSPENSGLERSRDLLWPGA